MDLSTRVSPLAVPKALLALTRLTAVEKSAIASSDTRGPIGRHFQVHRVLMSEKKKAA